MSIYSKIFRLCNFAKRLVSSSSDFKAGDVDESHKKMHFNSMLDQTLNLVQNIVQGRIHFCLRYCGSICMTLIGSRVYLLPLYFAFGHFFKFYSRVA